jgi:CheY-like chemotaxis protein
LHNSFQAIEMAVRTVPDYIIVSGVLDELSGIDLACAFSSMPTTSKIPVSLLTSMAADSPELKKLPPAVSLIRKNHFGDDLATAIAKHGVL